MSSIDSYKTFIQNHQMIQRDGQVLFIQKVEDFLNSIQTNNEDERIGEKSSIIIEAGTGIGKTIAYLISVIKNAPKNNKRIVISTATITLQEQLINKDLHLIKKIPEFSEITFKLAKGRSRYLCLNELESNINKTQDLDLFQNNNNQELEQELINKISKLYEDNLWDGDKDNLKISIPQEIWNKVTSSSASCLYKDCPAFHKCIFYKERENLLNSNIIIANHDLVLSDLSLGGGVILTNPSDTIYVFDEAHNLPKKAKEHFHTEIAINKNKELLKKIYKFLEKNNTFFNDISFKYKEDIQKYISEFLKLFDSIYTNYEHFVNMIQNDVYINATKNRIFRFKFGQINKELQDHILILIIDIQNISRIINNIKNLLSDEDKLNKEIKNFQIFKTRINIYNKEIYNLKQSFQMFIDNKEETFVKWIEFKNNEIVIKVYYLDASQILTENLFNKAFASILTSATLSINQNFQRFYQETGLKEEDITAISIPSPFNYNNICINFHSLKNDTNNPEFLNDLVKIIPSIILDKKGIFVYFTSKQNMHFVYENLFKLKDYILMQGQSSKQNLLEKHKNNILQGKMSILFGLDSFAEGLDLPKKYCEQIIITKLPFINPFNPFMEGLNEIYYKKNKNVFMEVQIPEATIKLIQICGRLIRTEEDFGQIDILDDRIIKKKYGIVLREAITKYQHNIKFQY